MALWQAINYNNTFMTGSYRTNGLFATAAGSSITADTPLKPFYKDANSFHTGKTAATTRNFGYTYPEISNDWSVSKDQLRTSVIRAVNILYGDGSLAGNPASPSSTPSASPTGTTTASVQPSTSTTAQQQAASSPASQPTTTAQQQAPSGPASQAATTLAQQPSTAATAATQPTTSAVNNGGGNGGWGWGWGWPWGGWNQFQPGPPSAPPAAPVAPPSPPPAKGGPQGPPAAKGGPRGWRGKRSTSAGAVTEGQGKLRRRGCGNKHVAPPPEPSVVNNAAVAAASYEATYPTESPSSSLNMTAQPVAVSATSTGDATVTLYALAVQVERSDLPLPCSIVFALGSQTAGQMTVLSMPPTGLTHSQIPLKRAIDKLGLTDEIDNDNSPTAIAKLTSMLQATIRMVRRKSPQRSPSPSFPLTCISNNTCIHIRRSKQTPFLANLRLTNAQHHRPTAPLSRTPKSPASRSRSRRRTWSRPPPSRNSPSTRRRSRARP